MYELNACNVSNEDIVLLMVQAMFCVTFDKKGRGSYCLQYKYMFKGYSWLEEFVSSLRLPKDKIRLVNLQWIFHVSFFWFLTLMYLEVNSLEHH